MNTEWTAEGFEQGMVEERIAILLETWDYTEEDMESEDREMQASVQGAQERAYELAVSFPSEISDDLFAEYVAEGLVA